MSRPVSKSSVSFSRVAIRAGCVLVLLSVVACMPAVAGASQDGVACPSAMQCTALDGGQQITFNPSSPGTPTPTTICAPGAYCSFGVACPSATQCTAVGVGGRQVTFNPTSPGTPTPQIIDIGASPGNTLGSVACPTIGQCTAVDGLGRQVTFNPTTPGARTSAAIDDIALRGVACPSPSQCTAVDGDGRQVTFNPLSPGTPAPTTVNPHTYLSAVACPTLSQCTAVGQSNGPAKQTTFVPVTGATLSSTTINAKSAVVTALACPALTQCTAVDKSGVESTFNPATGKLTSSALVDAGIRNGQGLNAVACPTTQQCTAVGASGRPVTFNPAFPNTFRVRQVKTNADGSITVIVGLPRVGTVTALATHVSQTRRGAVRIGKIEGNPTAGVASLKPGKRRILYARSASRTGQGRVTLHLSPSRRGRRLLAQRHRLNLRITIAYKPVGGFEAQRTKNITVRSQR